MNNLYSKFSINSDAVAEEIDRVYRNIIKKYTAASYKGTKETAEKKLASAREIYEILSDPVKRAAHDKALNITPESPYIHAAAKPAAQAKSGAKTNTKSGAKSAAKTGTKTGTKTSNKTGAKSAEKTNTKAGAETAAKTGAKTSAKSSTKSAAKSETKTGVKVKQSLGAETITEDGLSVRTVTYIPLSDKEFEQLIQDILELEGQIDELRGRGQTEKDLQKEIAALNKKIKKLKAKREKEQAERLKEQIALYDKHLESYKTSPFANSTEANTVEILATDIMSAEYETAAAEDLAVQFASCAAGAEPDPVAEVITLTDAPAEASGEKKKSKSKKKKTAEHEPVSDIVPENTGDSDSVGVSAVILIPPTDTIGEISAPEVNFAENTAEAPFARTVTVAENIAVPDESDAPDSLYAVASSGGGKYAQPFDNSAAADTPEIKSGALIGQKKGLGRGAFLTVGILLFIMFGVAAYIAAGSFFNTTFIKTYNIEYTASEGGYINGSPNQSVKKGENGAAVRAVAEEGYIFTGWSDGQTNPERTDYKIGQDFHVRAEFIKGIKVTYSTDGNGHISGSAVQYVLPDGDAEKVCAEGFNGFAFNKWSDGTETEERHDKNITSEIEVTASFVRGFMLIYNAEPGGRIEGKPVQAVKPGSYGQTVTAVADEGYKFDCWSDGRQSAERTDKADDNKIFAASFIRVFSLNYSAAAGGYIEGNSSQKIVKNSNGYPVTAIPNDGYEFDHWLVNGIKDTEQIFEERQETNATENLNIVAIFVPQYTVTYSVQLIATDTPGSISGISPQYVKEGLNADPVIAVAKDDGYIFDYWLVNGVKDTVNTGVTRTDTGVNKTLTIVAVFTQQYTINYSVILVDLAGSEASPGSITGGDILQYVKKGGSAVSVTALAANDGFVFTHWLIGGTTDTSQITTTRTDANVQSNLNIVAVFVRQFKITYAVESIDSINPGSISDGPAEQYVKEGFDAESVSATAASDDYVFGYWKVNSNTDTGQTDSTRTDLSVTQNLTVIAVFFRQYLITYTAGTGGKIRDADGEYTSVSYRVKDGDNAPPVEAAADTGYEFTKWTDNNSAIPLRTDTNITSDQTFAATFTETPFYGGDGSTDSPYGIDSPRRLMRLSAEYDKNGDGFSGICFVLTNDLDFDGITNFTPLCPITGFSGIFDGGGYKITNLNISVTNTNYAGLFAKLNSVAVISNLNIEANVALTAPDFVLNNIFVGILAGSSSANIINVSVSGSVSIVSSIDVASSRQHYIGGLVGQTESGSKNIAGCGSKVDITSEILTTGFSQEFIGGLVGRNLSAAIQNCTSDLKLRRKGNASYTTSIVGGLAGANSGDISDNEPSLLTKCDDAGATRLTPL